MVGKTNKVIEAVFLGALLTGVVSMVAGVALARLNWLSEVPPYGRQTPKLNVLLHPDKYATPDVRPLIRTLNKAGIVLVMVAVLALLAEGVVEFST
jgi:hypothetical protein